MFHYPQFLKNLDLVNIQVVFPGGWGQDIESEKSLHFLLEHCFFAPTKTVSDMDEWLWKNVIDFWSITSYESIRLNFTLKPEQVGAFVPLLQELVVPRDFSDDFLVSELDDLKNFWQTKRDQKEDQALRNLFPQENVVHPNSGVINNLGLEDKASMLALWKKKKPYLIVLGPLETEDLLGLNEIVAAGLFKSVPAYKPPTQIQSFKSPERLGWSFAVPASHAYELLVIELWDQVFKTKFFFEYHGRKMYVWTDALEYPHLLEAKIMAFRPTKNEFAKAKHTYLRFLEKIYHPQQHETMEKLSELIEGLHGHEFQAATYPIGQNQLDLRDYFSKVKYEDFLDFYDHFFVSDKGK